jgi:hypothetical protein
MVLRRETVRFQIGSDSIPLDLEEAKEFQARLSLAPGGRPLEREIQLAIENKTPVVVAENHTAAAVSVLATWFEEEGESSATVGELLAKLRTV